jgi:xanthine/uracil/vitamin C permease (AzgA family)
MGPPYRDNTSNPVRRSGVMAVVCILVTAMLAARSSSGAARWVAPSTTAWQAVLDQIQPNGQVSTETAVTEAAGWIGYVAVAVADSGGAGRDAGPTMPV